jgi:hypothetical protein
MTWSYGDWHEDRVALYDDSDDTMVCWLQKQGGVKAEALALIKAAPELLEACRLLLFEGRDSYACYCSDEDYMFHTKRDKCDYCIAAAAIYKAEGRGE